MPTVTLSSFYYVVGIVVLLAVAASTFLANRKTSADTAMTRAITALQAEIGALKDSNHRLELLVVEYRGKVELLEQHNQELKDMVAARPEWQLLMQGTQKQAQTAARIEQLLDSMPKDWQERQDEHYRKTSELLKRLAA